MTHGVFQVTRGHTYRGYTAGERFVAPLDRGREARAAMRGVIRLVESLTPTLVPGSYSLPPGWTEGKE